MTIGTNATAEIVQIFQTCILECPVNSGYNETSVNRTDYPDSCFDNCVNEQTQGWQCNDSDGGTGIPLAVSIVVAAVLIICSALFSGLTLGLLSLDLVALKVLESAGDEKEQEYAKKIIPIRTNGNLLLCTLLLGNTIVNNGFSILLADLTSGVVGLIVSVTAVLIFGEITPQAVCSRHALFIGAHTIYIVKFFRLLFFPICYPLSTILNYFLGRDIGNVYTVDEIKRLIELHATDNIYTMESGLNASDHHLLVAALEYKDKRVSDVMTSLDQCYMLDVEERLNFTLMLEVYRSGYTRIPVYSGERENIVGVLYAKDLILVDPEDEIELSTILSFRGRHGGHVFADTKLDKALSNFLSSGTHLMIVHERCTTPRETTPEKVEDGSKVVTFDLSPEQQEFGEAPGEEAEGKVVGIITLEDVIEELIRREIVDESDIYEDVEARVPRRIARKNDIDAFLKMFERKETQDKGLAPEEVKAVCAFLALNVEEFALLGRHEVQMSTLIQTGELIDRSETLGSSTMVASSPGSTQGSIPGSPNSEVLGMSPSSRSDIFSRALEVEELVLYTRGESSTHFILILQGKIEVTTSSEGFNFELGPWSILGNRALSQDVYIPDFDAVAIPPCRILKIEKAAYVQAVQSCKFAIVLGSRTARQEIKQAARRASISDTNEESQEERNPTRSKSRFAPKD